MLLMALSFFTGNIQDVILQEHIEKEDKVLVSLAGLKQVGLLYCFTRCDAPFRFSFFFKDVRVFSACPSDQRHS